MATAADGFGGDARGAEITTPSSTPSERALIERAFRLRHNVTLHDGICLALAEVLEGPLLTRDAALAAVPRVTAPVEIFWPLSL